MQPSLSSSQQPSLFVRTRVLVVGIPSGIPRDTGVARASRACECKLQYTLLGIPRVSPVLCCPGLIVLTPVLLLLLLPPPPPPPPHPRVCCDCCAGLFRRRRHPPRRRAAPDSPGLGAGPHRAVPAWGGRVGPRAGLGAVAGRVGSDVGERGRAGGAGC